MNSNINLISRAQLLEEIEKQKRIEHVINVIAISEVERTASNGSIYGGLDINYETLSPEPKSSKLRHFPSFSSGIECALKVQEGHRYRVVSQKDSDGYWQWVEVYDVTEVAGDE